MRVLSSLIIDAYSHITPTKYKEVIKKDYPQFYEKSLLPTYPMFDLEKRFRIMDEYPGIVQVLTVGALPPLEVFADSTKSVDMAKMANDEMAELVVKYPERFMAAIALLPMNNIEAALREMERAITELKFRGIYFHSHINDKSLDSPEFLPFFEKMEKYRLPVYIHPYRSADFPDYKTEQKVKYHTANVFGWPYETTIAMSRLVFGGILEKYPNLKVVTHHCGGMVPYLAERIVQHYGRQDMGQRFRADYLNGLNKPPIEYFKKFYLDTAIHGNTPALMCAYNFCGAGKLVFGADMPFGDQYFGVISYRKTIKAIEAMDITDSEKDDIFVNNTAKLLRLPL